MKSKKIVVLVTALVLLLSLFSFETGAEAAGTVYEYYYTLLSHDEQVIYETIRSNIESSADKYDVSGLTGIKTSFSLVGRNADELDSIFDEDPDVTAAYNAFVSATGKAVDAFVRDHAEYFWANGSLGAYFGMETSGVRVNSSTNIIVEGSIILRPAISSNKTGSSLAGQLASLKQTVESIGATSGSEYDKIKKIHDAICGKVSYNYSMAGDKSNPGNAYNALIGGSSVCQGYAMATKMACDTFGLKCICVSGMGYTSSGSEAHMWNLVQIGGKWYGYDATWDDQDTIMYDFFLNGSGTYPVNGFPHKTFSESHVEDKTVFAAPALNGEAYASASPTPAPTAKPTPTPTTKPTDKPTAEPTAKPTETPVPTQGTEPTAPQETPEPTEQQETTGPAESALPTGEPSPLTTDAPENSDAPEATPTEGQSEPAETDSGTTEKPEMTNAPDGKQDDGKDKKNGCKGTVSAGFTIMMAAVAIVSIKKRK